MYQLITNAKMIDWCEPNWIYTQYAAELYNTASSIFYLFAAIAINSPFIYGLNNTNSSVWAECQVYLVLVSITSAWYHATLSTIAQIADEMSIVLLVYHLFAIYIKRVQWDSRRILITGISTAAMAINPLVNAVLMISLGTVACVYIYITEHNPPIELKIAKAKFLIAIALWVADKICFSGFHLHFAWHFYSSMAVLWVVRWLARYRWNERFDPNSHFYTKVV